MSSFADITMALGWKPIHFALAGMMLVFGSFNTLSVKWADTMTSESLDGTQKKFNHPFVQAIGKVELDELEGMVNLLILIGMFLGEMLCMLAFWFTRWRASRQHQDPYPDINDANAPKKFNPLV